MRRILGTCSALVVLPLAAYAQSNVRVVHASPDAPAVDVIVNDSITAFTNLPFTGVTDYVDLAPGDYNFKVVPAGATDPVVIDADVSLTPGDFSVAAVNTLAMIEPLILVDDNTLDPSNARIRFVHASPDAPAVDIALAGTDTLLFSDVEFKESGGYIAVPGGSYDLEVRIAGTDTAVLSIPGLDVDNNTVYTAWAVGLAFGDPALGAVVSVDAVPEPAALVLLALGGLAIIRRR